MLMLYWYEGGVAGNAMATGQLFSKTTQALFYNYKQLPIQRMLDFDFLCGKHVLSALLCSWDSYKQSSGALMVHFYSLIVKTFLCLATAGRETPSVAGIINPGSEGFQKLFFGQEEIAIPVHSECVLHSLAKFFPLLALALMLKGPYIFYLIHWLIVFSWTEQPDNRLVIQTSNV